MAYWLLKEEPDHYSWSDLVRDGSTDWTGVHNALALQHLRRMAPGDHALFYHTGLERACVGLLRITSAPRPDRKDLRGSWSVRVAAVRPLRRPIPLSEVRTDPALAGLELLRIPRLLVVPLADDQWSRLLSHEDAQPWPRRAAKGSESGPGRERASRRKRTGARRRR
ncbi:MAG: EVE domain-containing protein [Thermoplasmata archaeon]